MSGIDEIGMESCHACIDSKKHPDWSIEKILHYQYWSIRSLHGDVLGYYNPDEFRTSRNARKDKVNPTSGTRERIVENPAWFVDSIHYFRCEYCNDQISAGHPRFEVMKSFVYDFVSGDVFPHLSR